MCSPAVCDPPTFIVDDHKTESEFHSDHSSFSLNRVMAVFVDLFFLPTQARLRYFGAWVMQRDPQKVDSAKRNK